MSSMENKCNPRQWKKFSKHWAERTTMCCQRYVILHATGCSRPTQLWAQYDGVKTPKHWVLDCLDFTAVSYGDRLSKWGLSINRIPNLGLLIQESCSNHFFIKAAGPHGDIYPQTEQEGRQIGSHYLLNSPVTHFFFFLNLRLTLCCPFVFLLCWRPLLESAGQFRTL